MSSPILPTPKAPGVVWSKEPPSGLSQSIRNAVEHASRQIPEGKSGFVGVATEKGMNIVAVQRLGDHMRVRGWIGKSGWDSNGFEVGAEILAVW